MTIAKYTAKQTEQQKRSVKQVEGPIKEKKTVNPKTQKINKSEINLEIDYFAKGAKIPEITKEQKDRLSALAKDLGIPATPEQTKPHTDEQFRELREQLLQGKYNS